MTAQAPLFDTYRTIERLINSGGFDRKQAESIAEAVHDGLAGGVATSADIARLEKRMAEQETRLTIRMGAGLIALAVFIALATDII